MDVTPFLPLITGAIGGAASVGVFKGPIQTVEDWWFIHFGQATSEKAAMLREKQEHNIKKYRDEIIKETAKIHPNNVKEPSLNVLGPSLEASKYYIEEEEVRNMFAKLIASSMDKSKKEIIHSSYVEIIKQMTPLDAENLLFVRKNELIAKFQLIIESGGFSDVFPHTYLGNPNEKRQSIISPSLNNLERLGLVTIDYDTLRNNESAYDEFLETSEYKSATARMNLINQQSELLKKNTLEENNQSAVRIKEVKIKKGLIRVTPFGENFCSTCL